MMEREAGTNCSLSRLFYLEAKLWKSPVSFGQRRMPQSIRQIPQKEPFVPALRDARAAPIPAMDSCAGRRAASAYGMLSNGFSN